MKSLRSTGSVTESRTEFQVGERAAEVAALRQHADRAGAAVLVRDGQGGRIGDLGELTAGRARALDLGDDLHPVGGCERLEGVDGSIEWLVWAAAILALLGLVVGWVLKRLGYGVGGDKWTQKVH